jgi:hypothetical protein
MLRETPISRYLQNLLDGFPSAFVQLVFLSSLRDPYTGRYLHEGWANVFSPEEVNRALRETHRSVFEAVVNLSLMDLSRQLRKHFDSLGQVEVRVANLWLETEPYYEMIPAGCSVLARRFFISQFRSALQVLIQAPGWTYLEEPAASPLLQPAPEPRPRWLN